MRMFATTVGFSLSQAAYRMSAVTWSPRKRKELKFNNQSRMPHGASEEGKNEEWRKEEEVKPREVLGGRGGRCWGQL